MNYKKIIALVLIIAFLTSFTKLNSTLNPTMQHIEKPVNFHATSLDIYSEKPNYTDETFTEYAWIHGNVIATFNYCTFNLDNVMEIYGNAQAIFNNCTIKLTNPSYPLRIFENATVAFYNSCAFELTSPLKIYTTYNTTTFDDCSFNLTSLDVYGSANVTFSGCDLIDPPGEAGEDDQGDDDDEDGETLNIYDSSSVSFSQCRLNFTAINIYGGSTVAFANATRINVTTGNDVAILIDGNAVVSCTNNCAINLGNNTLGISGNAIATFTNAFIEGAVEDYTGGNHGDGSCLDVSANGHVYFTQCTLNIYDTWFHNGTIVLTQSTLNLTETPYPAAAHHFEVLDRSQITIDATTILAPSSMFEVSGNATIRIWNDSVISFGLRSEIADNSTLTIEDSTVYGDLGVLDNPGGFSEFFPNSTFSASLTLKNATIHGGIANFRDAPCVTIQDNLTVVDIMTEVLWLKTDKNITIVNNIITSGDNQTDYTAWGFLSDSAFTINEQQYVIIARSGADVLINASQIYGLIATDDAQATLDNTTITAILLPGNEATLALTNCTILGEGNLAAQHGSVQSYSKGYFSGDSNWNSSTSFLDCTIHGKIFMFSGTNPGNTIVSQRSTYDKDVFSYLDTIADGEVLVLDRQGVHLTVTAWETGDLMTNATVDVNDASVPTVTNETLHFELDPVLHQIPGQATFGIIASNGSGSLTRNFTISIPSDGIRKATFWNTTSDFANNANNNCSIGTNNVTLTWVNVTSIAYDFTNDSDGSNPSGWFVFEGSNRAIDVESGLDGHAKIVELSDNSSVGGCYMINTFASAKTSGTVEFWMRAESGWYGRYWVDFRYGGGGKFRFDLRHDGGLRIWGPSNGIVLISDEDWENDRWYHVRAAFDCGTDKVQVWIDRTYKGEYAFYSASGSIEDIKILSWAGTTTGKFYVDAIDYSWAEGYFPERSYYTGHSTGFLENGTWTSNVTDLEDPSPCYDEITISCDINASTSVHVSYQMSHDSSSWVSYNGSSWETGWSAWTNNSISLNLYGRRYFQVRTLLNTSNINQSPLLRWINVSYRINFGEVLWNSTSEFQDCANNTCVIGTNNLTLPLSKTTYDFTNDANGSEPAGWTVEKYGSTHCLVNQSKDNHSKVVEFWDDSDLNVQMYQSFTGQVTGTIEFWIYGVEGDNNYRDYFSITFYDDQWCENFRFLIDWDTGDDYLKQYGPGDEIVGSGNFTSDTWHHLRVWWDCTSDEFKVWHNTEYMGNFTMRYTQFDNVGALNFWTNCSNSKNDFYVYLDAIDYSWSDGYFPERSFYYHGEESMGNNNIWESNVIDLEATTPYYDIIVSCDINENISVYLSYRMSADNSSWDDWIAWTNGSIALKTYGKLYFQVKVLLTTKNPSQTPTVFYIKVDAYFF